MAPYLEETWYEVAFGKGPISGRWSSDWWAWAQQNFEVTAGPYLRQYEGPVLWFLAERDQNVPLVSTRAALKRAFEESRGGDQELVVIEDAPHSFLIPDPTGPPRYAEGFFDTVERWLTARGLSDSGCWDGAF